MSRKSDVPQTESWCLMEPVYTPNAARLCLLSTVASVALLPLTTNAQPTENGERASIMLGAFITDRQSSTRLDSEDAVVFDDEFDGVEAGRSGHFGYVVGVDRLGQAAELRRHGADVVVPDLTALLA